MKKFLALLLVLVMALGLVACSGGGNNAADNTANNTSNSQTEDTTGGDTSGDAVEIALWSFNIGGFTEAANWDEIIAAFNEKYPNITVKVTPINYQDGDQQLTTAISGGNAPDVIFEGPERIVGNYAREGLMVDLSDLWEASGSDIAEGLASVSQLDGAYYMFPVSAAAHCMGINYEVFEAAGALQYIDDETRTWTTDGFVAAMAAIRDAIADGTVNVAVPGIIYCGAQGGDQGTRQLVNNLYSDYFVTEDGSSYNANSANNVKALTLLQSMVADGSPTPASPPPTSSRPSPTRPAPSPSAGTTPTTPSTPPRPSSPPTSWRSPLTTACPRRRWPVPTASACLTTRMRPASTPPRSSWTSSATTRPWASRSPRPPASCPSTPTGAMSTLTLRTPISALPSP